MKNKTLLAAALCASLFAAGSVQADDDVTLRFSNATNVAAKDAAVDLMDVAKKESDGTIKIKHFPDNMLGDDRVATESTIMGDIDIVLTQPSVLTAFVPDCYAWEAPFLFNNADEGIKCFSSELASKINNQVEKKGLKVLAMVGNGFRNYTNNKVAVKVPSDVKGQKVRVMETDIQMAMWQAWGANPTPMAFAELLPALQQGTVDAQENPLAIIDANKLYEVQHYISLTGHLYSPQIMLMNKAKYDSLSEKQQKAIDDAVKAFVAKHRQRSVELDNMSIDKFKKAGCEVVELNDADRAQWQKTAVDAGVYDLIKSKMDHPEYLDQIINKQY
mgnify:CR=1 FL=1